MTRKLGLLEKSEASCYGITLSQCHILLEIRRAGSISVNALSKVLGLDKSTMSRNINNMVVQGLVTRGTDPENRRHLSIALSGKGQDLILNICDNMDRYYLDVLHSVPEDKREKVLESLELLTRNMPEHCC
jgi:DNA-binding MarR family transcriptional regulator